MTHRMSAKDRKAEAARETIRSIEQSQREISQSYIRGELTRSDYQHAIYALHAEYSRIAELSRCVCPACTDVSAEAEEVAK